MKNLNIFKLPGSYIGLVVGFIASLQIKNNRMFLLEGKRDFVCDWNPIKELSCSNLILINIVLFLMIGFLIGGFVHKKIY
jgi:hypothetical protein